MSIFTIFCLLLLFGRPFVIATNDNATATEGWVSDPAGRGTFSLIISCLLTLGLCVWSAMHLNVPPPNEPHIHTWLRNLKWGAIGVFAPELILFAAWRQYSSAKSLQIQVNKQLDAMEIQSSADRKPESQVKDLASANRDEQIQPISRWTMEHGFYAGMGGFTFDTKSFFTDDGIPFVPHRHRLTLTARGVAFLATCRQFPSIKRDDITDKSKADSLAKTLACLQAGWMVVQVIGRAVLGLHVTLLEVNTLGHVICALLTYLLWWNKPRQIYEPTSLEGEWVRPLCAYMYMSSQISGQRNPHAALLRRTWYDPEMTTVAFLTPGIQTEPGNASGNGSRQNIVGDSQTKSPGSIEISRETLSMPNTHADGDFPSGTFVLRHIQSRPEDLGRGFRSLGKTEQAHSPASMHLLRWKLAEVAVHTYPAIQQRFMKRQDAAIDSNEAAWYESATEELLTIHVADWPSEDLLRGIRGLIMGMILWFASMAYGAVHLAAWNEYFPSKLEAWLWRSSSIYITWSGLVWFSINLLAHLSKSIDAYWERVIALQASRVSHLFLGFLCSICGIAYVFERAYLVVEAIVSIRQMPVTAYKTPDWAQIIPHRENFSGLDDTLFQL